MEPTHQAEGSALQLTNIEEDKYEEEQSPSSLPEESGAHHPQVGIYHPYLLLFFYSWWTHQNSMRFISLYIQKNEMA